MVDKTLKAKQAELLKLSEVIKEAEAKKAKLTAEIIAEYEARGIDAWGTYKIVETTRETVKKADIPSAIWDRFKSVSTSRYLRKCKA